MYRHIRDSHSDDSNFKKNKKEMESIDSSKESTIIQNLNIDMSPDAIDPSISSESENKEIKISSILTKQNDGNGKASVQTNKYVGRKNKCPHCCKVILARGKNLLSHMKACELYSKFIQNIQNGYKCLICLDQVLKKRTAIHAHIKKCKDEKLDKSVDEQEFLNKQKRKLKQGYTNTDKKCEYCKKIFKYQFQCKQHIKACKIYFKYIQNVPNGYRCLLCLDQVSERRSHIYDHIKNCKEEKMGKGVDEQEFLNEQRRKLLRDYVAIENNIRKCDYCEKIFNKRLQYSQHIKPCNLYAKFLEKTSIGFNCLICLNQRTTSIHDMYRHIRDSHSDDSNFKKNKKEMESIDSSKESTIIQNLNIDMSPDAIDPSISSESENKEIKISSILTKQNDGNGKASVQTNKCVERKKKCPHCCTVMLTRGKNLLRHIKACEIYSKYIQKVPKGYKCLICLDQVSKERCSMYAHIKKCKDEKLDKNVDEQDFLTKQRGKLKQDYTNTEKKCENCKTIFDHGFQCAQHIRACKIYFKYFQNVPNGYKCLICLDQILGKREHIYGHIREKHSDDSNFKKNISPMKSIELKPNNKDNHSRDERGNFKCKNCDMVTNSANNFSKHMKGCKFYSKFFSLTNAGLQCLLCSVNFTIDSKGREYIRQHIRKIHFNNIDFKKVEEVMEKSETPEMNSKQYNINEEKGKTDLNFKKNNETIDEMKKITALENNDSNRNIEEIEKSENPEMIKDSKNSDVDAELEKTFISRCKLFQENNTESQNVMECEYCVGDFVNKIHLKFCQTASKYVMEQTCLICDSESDSPHDAIKHVREHHLNVICEFIESEKSKKSNDYIKIKNANVNLLYKIDSTNHEFELQNQEKSLRDENGKSFQQSNYELEDLGTFIKENHGENNIASERYLQSELQNGAKTISGGHEIIDIEEMKVEVIEIEPCTPEKEKSSLPHSHPQNQNQIIIEPNGSNSSFYMDDDFQVGNTDFENGQTLPKIANIFCVKEQAENQLDHEMDDMEILPHD